MAWVKLVKGPSYKEKKSYRAREQNIKLEKGTSIIN